MVRLILVRHGQSEANAENRYTGWDDVPLSLRGIKEAQEAATKLQQVRFNPTCIHTSVLIRAVKTALIISNQCKWQDRPLCKSWRLNERHYGALRGLNKQTTRELYGNHQVALWRRSFNAVPPLLDHPSSARRYRHLDPRSLPLGESLAMASRRILPYFQDKIAPLLLAGQDQLIVAHGSTIRALIKYLEGISDEGIDGVEVGNAQPWIYDLDQQLNVVQRHILDRTEDVN